jgi:hypothetical protein
MNIVRYMMFLVLGMLLGLVLSGLLSSLVAWAVFSAGLGRQGSQKLGKATRRNNMMGI